MTSLRPTLGRLALAASLALGLAAPPARADSTPRVATPAPAPRARGSVDPATFDALAAAEDDSLASRRASGEEWSTGEIVVVVLLLIFLFPIGLIVLIVLLIMKA
jgi:hypothetical protein